MGNEAQIDYWSGEAGTHWADEADAMDGMLGAVGEAVLARAQLTRGERVLDIGCGAGSLALAAAQRVGAAGQVIGVDVSAQQLEIARRRAAGAGSHAVFIDGDAASWRAAAPADVVVSRFGVMFFDQPAAAFANILQSVKPNGRLVFACWRNPQENEMATGMTQATAHLFPPPTEKPDPRAPGPFAFSDPDYVSQLLTTAGWQNIEFQTWDGALPLPKATAEGNAEWLSNLGPAARLRRENPTVPVASITTALTPFVATLKRDTGFALQGAAWIVTAQPRL